MHVIASSTAVPCLLLWQASHAHCTCASDPNCHYAATMLQLYTVKCHHMVGQIAKVSELVSPPISTLVNGKSLPTLRSTRLPSSFSSKMTPYPPSHQVIIPRLQNTLKMWLYINKELSEWRCWALLTILLHYYRPILVTSSRHQHQWQYP